MKKEDALIASIWQKFLQTGSQNAGTGLHSGTPITLKRLIFMLKSFQSGLDA